MSWGYTENDGPDTWVRNFPHAGLLRQSPIDIVTSRVRYDAALPPLVIKYDKGDISTVQRSTHGVEFSAAGQNSTLTGGPLGKNVYKLGQFHFHWSDTDKDGSEHTVNGETFAAELHLVHYNSTEYQSVAQAAPHPGGLAVLGVLIQVGKQNDGFQEICKYLQSVTYKGEKTSLSSPLDPVILLPGNTKDYWTYEGSLTTPPCYESVRWILFKEPVQYSSKQIDMFRSLYDDPKPASANDQCCRLLKNYRPPQPLNDRVVSASFK